jgi:REP element-mobilizing transposase RayT
MNHRDYKDSVPGGYFHIYNRGNAKENVFLDGGDYQFFLLRLAQNIYPDRNRLPRRARPLPAESFSLISYCLMPNHFHLLLKQNKEISTGILMKRICTSYSKYFNLKYKRVGHVFQDQFKQRYIEDNRYLKNLSAYIHQNPYKDGLVINPAKYPWSSFGEYLEERSDGWCEKDIILAQFPTRLHYSNFVEEYQPIRGVDDEMSMMPIDR